MKPAGNNKTHVDYKAAIKFPRDTVWAGDRWEVNKCLQVLNVGYRQTTQAGDEEGSHDLLGNLVAMYYTQEEQPLVATTSGRLRRSHLSRHYTWGSPVSIRVLLSRQQYLRRREAKSLLSLQVRMGQGCENKRP